MKGSLITVGVFAAGCLLGYFDIISGDFLGDKAAVIILQVLMFLVGVGIGSDPNLRKIVRSVDFKILLLPLSTIVGTLLFSALVAFFISKWSVWDCMAVGSGFGYYSISSVLISEIKTDLIGAQLATELAAIALLTNVFRELFTLVGAPLMYRFFGPFAPISSAGVTSVDVAMPVIVRVAGNSIVPYALIHGVLVDVSTPFFVTFFCSL